MPTSVLKEGVKQSKQDSIWATQESQPGLVLNPAPRGHLEGEEVQHTGARGFLADTLMLKGILNAQPE